MLKKNIHFTLACIGFLFAWCIWVIFGFIAGYTPGWQSIFTVKHLFKVKSKFLTIPYEKIRPLTKEKNFSQYIDFDCTQNEFIFLSFILHPLIRHGIRSLLLAFGLIIIIFAGVDWGLLYIVASILLIFGILRLTQGILDIA